MMLYGFDDYDGIIDHDADRQDDAEKREVVNRKPEAFHRGERADQRNRNSDERDDCRTPGLEKDQDDENDQRDCFEERLLYFVDRLADRNGRVVDNCVVEPDGKALLEFGHLLSHRVGGGECVRARELENGDRSRRLSAELAIDRVLASGELSPRDIAHASDLSVRASLNDDFAELLLDSASA